MRLALRDILAGGVEKASKLGTGSSSSSSGSSSVPATQSKSSSSSAPPQHAKVSGTSGSFLKGGLKHGITAASRDQQETGMPRFSVPVAKAETLARRGTKRALEAGELLKNGIQSYIEASWTQLLWMLACHLLSRLVTNLISSAEFVISVLLNSVKTACQEIVKLMRMHPW